MEVMVVRIIKISKMAAFLEGGAFLNKALFLGMRNSNRRRNPKTIFKVTLK
jgi:hypothetical protein